MDLFQVKEHFVYLIICCFFIYDTYINLFLDVGSVQHLLQQSVMSDNYKQYISLPLWLYSIEV